MFFVNGEMIFCVSVKITLQIPVSRSRTLETKMEGTHGIYLVSMISGKAPTEELVDDMEGVHELRYS